MRFANLLPCHVKLRSTDFQFVMAHTRAHSTGCNKCDIRRSPVAITHEYRRVTDVEQDEALMFPVPFSHTRTSSGRSPACTAVLRGSRFVASLNLILFPTRTRSLSGALASASCQSASNTMEKGSAISLYECRRTRFNERSLLNDLADAYHGFFCWLNKNLTLRKVNVTLLMEAHDLRD